MKLILIVALVLIAFWAGRLTTGVYRIYDITFTAESTPSGMVKIPAHESATTIRNRSGFPLLIGLDNKEFSAEMRKP